MTHTSLSETNVQYHVLCKNKGDIGISGS